MNMNRLRTANPRRLALIAVLLLLVTAGLTFWLRDVVREVFVLPLSYLLFLAGVFLRTTAQVYFWMVLVLLSVLIAYRSLRRRRRMVDLPPNYAAAELSYDPARRGRVYSWLSKYEVMVVSENSYYGNTFHQSLGRLLLELLAHRYRLPPLQVEQRLRADALDVPADIREYILRSLRPPEPQRRGLLAELWETIARAFRRWRLERANQVGPSGRGQPDPRVDPLVARVIQYIEEELEVQHDDTGG